MLGYEIIISLWDICIAICLARVVCERLTIMARKLIETLFTYSFATYYGLMMFFAVLWQMIRRLAIPPRAKRRETRKWVGPMFVGHVVNFSCVHFTPYKHSSYALQWVDSSKESVLMPLLPSLFSLSLFGTIYPTEYCFYLQRSICRQPCLLVKVKGSIVRIPASCFLCCGISKRNTDANES